MNLSVIHFLPLEYYPPVINLLNFISSRYAKKFREITVFTTHNKKNRVPFSFSNSTSRFKIYRSPFPETKDRIIKRIFKYLHFNLSTLLHLIAKCPQQILYYESYSAWPVYIYTRFINKKCQILIHNHEYASKTWYANTMKQVRYFHQLEINWLYPRAIWQSQTNSDRLRFFHQDYPFLKPETLRVMPNYPPRSWQSTRSTASSTNSPLKLIYVGSLSFENTYIREICNWVAPKKGLVQLDIYSFNLYEDVKNYLSQLSSPYINLFEKGIEYNQQPKVLKNYHIGLILYKANNKNYTFNAPNKLFEYLACGLDIWYPSVLQGPQPYVRKDVIPKVLPIDLKKLQEFNWEGAANHKDIKYENTNYFCEEVYQELVNFMSSST
jgi:hypothetical protein